MRKDSSTHHAFSATVGDIIRAPPQLNPLSSLAADGRDRSLHHQLQRKPLKSRGNASIALFPGTCQNADREKAKDDLDNHALVGHGVFADKARHSDKC